MVAMGLLVEPSSLRKFELEPKQTVGRARSCALRLVQRYVSGQHASIRWSVNGWRLSDLGSRNGTFYDGVRLPIGQEWLLERGRLVAFGKQSDPAWSLADDSPPQTMVVPLDGGEPLVLEGEMLALPSSDNPRATIYADHSGQWVIERQDEPLLRLTSGGVFQVVGRAYRFSCVQTPVCTNTVGSAIDLYLNEVAIEFTIAKDDEQHVGLRMTFHDRSVELTNRQQNQLLLCLARRRIKDQTDGLPDSVSGWTDYEELSGGAASGASQLDFLVFRTRRTFAENGLSDAARIVERRPHARQIRIGTNRISIAHNE